jgi:DNA-binding response OmpR family regulator
MNSTKTSQNNVRILVVDHNKVFAGFVKETLEAYVKDAEIDIAVNVWELRRKLEKNNYRLIIADLSVALDGLELGIEFDKLSTPVYLWSCGNTSAKIEKTIGYQKPTSLEDLHSVIPNLIAQF